ncbi:MAG TPA: TrkA family potassium uptake protein [Dehalococcoidia bacterium]|nr:TrkA family potassium uptake protein [Dehalococcoidia bacterium]
MRVLIFGCNRLNSSLVGDLSDRGNEITVLGRERDCLESVATFPGVRVVLTAEPMMQDYLQEGGIDHADVFLAMSSDDHENILVAQIAKHIFNVPKVVCHLGSPQLQVMYAALGLDVVGYSFGLLQDVRQAIQG